MAEIKWIKLSTGLPDNRKIKQIRKLPDGDTIALMWIFLMCLAGETNDDGLVYFTSEIPYTDEMLAEEFKMEVNTVRLGLQTFQRFGMLDIVDNIICLSAWEKWQSVDKMAELREYNRLAKQKSRAKQKLLASVNDMSMTSQPCQGTDIDKEEEKKEKKKNKEVKIKEEDVLMVASLLGKYDYSLFVDGTAELQNAILAFMEFRKGIKKPMTEHAVDLLIKKLNGITTDLHEQIEIINQSIMNGWQGIFPLKEDTKIRKGANNGRTGRTDAEDYTEAVGTWL